MNEFQHAPPESPLLTIGDGDDPVGGIGAISP
jgi:hypothetical protein